MKSVCDRCGENLRQPTLEDQIEMESRYREAFPNTWNDPNVSITRMRVCDTCFEEMNDAETPQEFETRMMWTEDDDD